MTTNNRYCEKCGDYDNDGGITCIHLREACCHQKETLPVKTAVNRMDGAIRSMRTKIKSVEPSWEDEYEKKFPPHIKSLVGEMEFWVIQPRIKAFIREKIKDVRKEKEWPSGI